MCWCTPELRTPDCGKPDCHPPGRPDLKFKRSSPDHTVLWSGTLSRGGHKPEPFNAKVVEYQGEFKLLEQKGLATVEVSPHEVDGETWLNALAVLAQQSARRRK